MDEKLPPVSLYPPSPTDNRRNGKTGKVGRIAKILCRAAVILFLCYCAARAYYVMYPPASSGALKGTYCCSCKGAYDYQGYTHREALLLEPQSFFLPILDVSWNPLHVSWQVPDGSYETVIDKPFILDNFSSRNFTTSSGYFFFAPHEQIELITNDGHVTLVPIRWGSARFLVEPARIADFCRGPVVATRCYYSDNVSVKGKPVYWDGTPVCPSR